MTDSAPISQLMLTVQFAPPAMAPNPIQLADIYGPFRDEYPIFEQAGRAGPMPVDPQTVEVPNPFGSPRSSFWSVDRQWNILFQEDRFSLAWHRLSPLSVASEYPGYDAVRSRALTVWEGLRAKMFASAMAPVPIVGEVSYTDHFAIAEVSYQQLSSVFSILNPDYSAPLVSLNANWVRPYADAGFIQTAIASPALRSDGVVVSQVSSTARFRITAGGWQGLSTPFDTGHRWAIEAFESLIKPSFRAI